MTDDPPRGPRPRLFVAFRLPSEVVEAVAAWQRSAIHRNASVRPMPSDQFHVTAVFLGSQPDEKLDWVRDTMQRLIGEARCPVFRVDRYRETSRVGMVTLREDVLPGDHAAGRGSEAVGRLMLAFEAAGIYKREHREWRPHITVARFREAPRLTLQPPSIPSFQPTDVTLFQSILGSNGSTYVERGSLTFRAEG